MLFRSRLRACASRRVGSSPTLGRERRDMAGRRAGFWARGHLAQLARASRLHRGGRGFESLSAHKGSRGELNRSTTIVVKWHIVFFITPR